MAILVSLSDRKTSTPSWIPTWPVGGEFRIYKRPRSQPTDIEVTIWMQKIPRISESPKATRQQKHQVALTSRIPYKTVLQRDRQKSKRDKVQLWRFVSTGEHQAVGSSIPSVLPPRRRLIHHQPVETELPRRIDKFSEIDRFAHKAVGAKVVTRSDISFLFAGCQDNNRQSSGPLVRAKASQNTQTINFGQLHVEQYDFRHDLWIPAYVAARREKIVNGFLSIADHDDFVRDIAFLECVHR